MREKRGPQMRSNSPGWYPRFNRSAKLRPALVAAALCLVALAADGTSGGYGGGHDDDDGGSLQVSKSVAQAQSLPVLGLQLAVDKTSAIPGDVLNYSATVSNTGSLLTVSGNQSVKNTGHQTTTVAFFSDV